MTFLDFGLVKWFTDDDVALLAEMIKTMVLHHDVHAFRPAVEAAGFLRPDPALDDEQVADYFAPLLRAGARGAGRSASRPSTPPRRCAPSSTRATRW